MFVKKPYIIGITGGSGSGKTYFVDILKSQFSKEEVCLITQDNYYKDKSLQQKDINGIENFDLPESIDDQKLFKDLNNLISGETIYQKEYSFNNPDVNSKMLEIRPAPVIIVEGISIFCFKSIRALLNLTILIDAKESIKVKRRIVRDAKERGYDLEDVLYRYEHHVSPFYNKYILPLKDEVDLVIPNNKDFFGALDVLKVFIQDKLNTPEDNS